MICRNDKPFLAGKRSFLAENGRKFSEKFVFSVKFDFFYWWRRDSMINRIKTTVRYLVFRYFSRGSKSNTFGIVQGFRRPKTGPSLFLFTPRWTTKGLRSTAVDQRLSTIIPRTGLWWTFHIKIEDTKTSVFEKTLGLKKPRYFKNIGISISTLWLNTW